VSKVFSKLYHSKKIIFLFVVFALIVCNAESGFAENIVNVQFTIKPSSYSHIPLYLKQGAAFSCEINVLSGGKRDIDTWFMPEKDFASFSKGMSFNVFPQCSGNRISQKRCEISIPDDGIYYLVFNNKFSLTSNKFVQAYVAVSPDGWGYRADGSNRSPDMILITGIAENLNKTINNLGDIFNFPSHINTFLKPCGQANAFAQVDANPPNITICTELVNQFIKSTKDQEKVKAGISFVFLHELGHTLMYKWDLPLWNNEDAIDEFAAVIVLMGNRIDPILAQIQNYTSNRSALEDLGLSISKAFMNDRHSLNLQRARNIAYWVNNSQDVLRRWQKILVPYMQTEKLRDLLQNPEPWADIRLIGEELRKR
jgi:hypothetical protein